MSDEKSKHTILEETNMPVIHSKNNAGNGVASNFPRLGTSEEESDRKWKDAFANTTEEEFDWLEKMFLEDEEKYGVIPLDFTDK